MPMVMKSLLMLGGLLYLAQLTVNLHRQFQSPAWRLAVKALAALMTFYFVVALLGHYGGPDSSLGQVQAFFSGIGASLDPSVAMDARSHDLATVSIVMVGLLVDLTMTG